MSEHLFVSQTESLKTVLIIIITIIILLIITIITLMIIMMITIMIIIMITTTLSKDARLPEQLQRAMAAEAEAAREARAKVVKNSRLGRG